MKIHTTNYKNTLIEIAGDCTAIVGEMPPLKGTKISVANLQFDFLFEKPYQYTSDEVLFGVFAIRKELLEGRYRCRARNLFF